MSRGSQFWGNRRAAEQKWPSEGECARSRHKWRAHERGVREACMLCDRQSVVAQIAERRAAAQG